MWSARFRSEYDYAVFEYRRSAKVLQALERVQDQFDRFRDALEGQDTAALMALLNHAKQVRDALGS